MAENYENKIPDIWNNASKEVSLITESLDGLPGNHLF